MFALDQSRGRDVQLPDSDVYSIWVVRVEVCARFDYTVKISVCNLELGKGP